MKQSPLSNRLPPRLLVVDDEEDLREMVRMVLVNAGLTDVDEAVNGEVALAMLRDVPYNLIITDGKMPRLDGLGLLKALRDWPERRHIPVLVLSASNADAAIATGAKIVLRKPLVAEELIASVRLLLAQAVAENS